MCGSGSVFQIRIHIQEAPEYRSNTDPYKDPQHHHRYWLISVMHTAEIDCDAHCGIRKKIEVKTSCHKAGNEWFKVFFCNKNKGGFGFEMLQFSLPDPNWCKPTTLLKRVSMGQIGKLPSSFLGRPPWFRPAWPHSPQHTMLASTWKRPDTFKE